VGRTTFFDNIYFYAGYVFFYAVASSEVDRMTMVRFMPLGAISETISVSNMAYFQ
jgi:hypothetical protein